MNRATGELRVKLNRVFLYAGCMLTILLIYEYTDQRLMHSAVFYRVLGLAMPPVLVGIARASGYRWAATKMAAIYFVLWLAALWLVPLVPAQPKLGPVYTSVVADRRGGSSRLSAGQDGGKKQVAASGDGWCRLCRGDDRRRVAYGWLFSFFGRRQRIFGMTYFAYMMRPSDYHYAHEFAAYEKTHMQFWLGMAYAGLAAVLTTRIGLAWGEWMRQVKR